jgi:hypothetical protein
VAMSSSPLTRTTRAAACSADVAIQIEFSVRHGGRSSHGSGGESGGTAVRHWLAAGQILLPEHSAGQEPGTRTKPPQRAATRACPGRSHWARRGGGSRPDR